MGVGKRFTSLIPKQIKEFLLSFYYKWERSRGEGWYRYYLWTFPVSVEHPFHGEYRRQVFEEQERRGIENIPVFLISFNRLSYLRIAIERLEQFGLTNIIIIDNASSYEPLLDYYQKIPYKVIYMDKNYGHRVFWKCPELSIYRNDFYVVSDPDVIPIEDCPYDFIKKLFYTLKKYPNLSKVGLSLKLDDLPEEGVFGEDVIHHEKEFYEYFIKEDSCYIAPVDTTFALYPPDSIANKKMSFYCALRTAYPYQARHLPWYKTKNDVNEEDQYYSQLNKYGTWDVAK